MSETFATNAVVANASYPGGGSSPQEPGRATLSVRYDADTRSYTVTEGSRSQLFRPQDIVATANDPRGRTYVRTEGAVTDTLTLSQPGDSSNFTYRYAGVGLWRRTDTAGGVSNNRTAAFSYGVRTPDANLPRTGIGSFAVVLGGEYATDERLVGFDGSGLLRADFATGDWTTSGTTRLRSPYGDGTHQVVSYGGFTGTGRTGGGSNALVGTLDLTGLLVASAQFAGTFYGPAAGEVAGSFYSYGSQNSRTGQLAGTLIGRTGTVAPVLETLVAPLSPLSVQYYAAEVNYAANANGSFRGATLGGTVQGELRYRADPRTYDVGAGVVFGPDNRVAAESDARMTVYRATVGRPETPTVRTFTVYEPGAGNPALVLSYLAYAGETYVRSDASRRDVWQVFGLESNPFLLPRTGTGSYSGLVQGSAVGSGEAADRYTLRGTTGFEVDFAAQSATGSMVLAATNTRTGTASDLGTYTFTPLSFPGRNMNGNVLNADITGVAGANGRLAAHFYGPAAEEIGGTFTLLTPGAGTVLIGSGALVARRR